MKRVVALVLIAVAVLLVTDSVSIACGDKFLVPGRGPQFNQAFAATQPGHILIYRNASSTVAQSVMDDDLRQTLERVGHQVKVVETAADLEKAINSGKYDIVLADVADVETMSEPTIEKAPMMLPVVYKASWMEVSQLKEAYQIVFNAPSRVSQMLAVVDEAVKLSRI